MTTQKMSIFIGSADGFDRFITPFESERFARKVADALKVDYVSVKTLLDTYLNEMRFGYSFLASRLPGGKMRILEVGSGLGLLSIYLHQQGHDVVALEPSAPAFDMMNGVLREIWDLIGDDSPRLLEKGAEELCPTEDGTFDFIFSINVMEHISQLDRAFAAIANVLKEDGIWVNSCPNYVFPYEPHYALPLIPFAPNISRRLLTRQIEADPETWNTLNFITWFKVKDLANKNAMNLQFEKGTLHASLARIGEDEVFAKRHKGGLVSKVYKVLQRLGVLSVTRLIPTAVATPMIFKLTRKDRGLSSRLAVGHNKPNTSDDQ